MSSNYKNWQIHLLGSRSCGALTTSTDNDYQYEREFSKEDADVCLNCTKAKCRGTDKCFANAKRAQKGKGI